MRPEDVAEVHIINLKTRPDRWASITAAINSYSWPFPVPQRFGAIDGRKVGKPSDYTYHYGVNNNVGRRGFYESAGAWGCKQSHVTLLQDCIMRDVPAVLILEDDALITREFGQQVREFMAEVPDDWEGVQLGGQHIAPPTAVNDLVVKVNYAQRTHAYLARADYMRALYARWVHAGVHLDWMHEGWQHERRVYAPVKWLVGQIAGRSDINGNDQPAEIWNAP